jgi:anti-sigma B factor antagonist
MSADSTDSPQWVTASDNLDLAVSNGGSQRRIDVAGELDLASAPVFDASLTELTREPYGAIVIVDLSRLKFLDCSGLGVLVAHHYAVKAAGGQLIISRPSTRAQRLIILNRLEGVFEIH